MAGSGIGGVFNLGKTNSVNASTVLSGSTNGQQLRVVNPNTGAGATGVGISTSPSRPPLAVNSTVRVRNLNADLVDGVHASALQRRVSGTCANRSAIAAVNPNGSVSCAQSAIFPIQHLVPPDYLSSDDFSPSSLQVDLDCGHGGGAFIIFKDAGSSVATLNWMYSDGGTTSTVNADGVAIPPSVYKEFPISGTRLEGQFIWSEPHFVVTVNLHEFNGTECEVNGTAEVAYTP
jgi:hypothetical protein